MIFRPNTRQLRAVGEHYLITPQSLIRDRSISAKAKDLLLRMLTAPDNWQFNKTSLTKWTGISARQLGRHLAELRKAKYLDMTRIKRGDSWEWFYVVSSLPLPLAMAATQVAKKDSIAPRVIPFTKKAAGK